MTPAIESRSFAWRDPAARAFLADRGYVVVNGVLEPDQRRAIAAGWNAVVADAAARVGLSPAEFVGRFPQNRDLWRKHAWFERLLFGTTQGGVARRLLGVSGVRLFHDHAICKPAQGSGAIALGGGTGTLSEIAVAWQLGKPIVALGPHGWAGRLAGEILDSRSDAAVRGCRSVDDAVAACTELLATVRDSDDIGSGVRLKDRRP